MSTYTLKVDETYTDARVDVFLAKNLPEAPSRSFIKNLIVAGLVTVNGKVIKAHYALATGDEVTANFVNPDIEGLMPENIPLDIFYEDDDIIVVNKPRGLIVHPAQGEYTGTLVNALLYHCQKLSSSDDPLRPGIVHRLDKETSGLIVAAKNNKAHSALAKQFEGHEIFKEYVALVEGAVEFDEGIIDAPLGKHPRFHDKKAVVYADSKEAITTYRVIKRSKKATLIALFPQTGRTHQLRVHMAHLGHSILGDDKYGKKHSFHRLALHARCLGIFHPRTHKFIEFSIRIPDEFYKIFEQ